MTRVELIEMLRGACAEAGGNAAWARRHCVTRVYVHEVLKGKKQPGPAIYRAFGLKAVRGEITFEPDGREE
jgi:hypothetical protein